MTEVQLRSFVDTAQNVRDDSRIALNKDRTGVTGGSGRVVSWVGGFRSASNRRSANAFANSLRGHYGNELADLALKSAGIEGAAKRGRPLRARQVRVAVHEAERLKTSFRQQNAVVASQVGAAKYGQILGPHFLKEKAAQLVRDAVPHGAFMAQHLDMAALSAKVERAIVEAGDQGAHLVTTEEAGKIQEAVLNNEIESVRRNLIHAAEAKLNIDDPTSMPCRLFDQAAAATEGAEGLRFKELSPFAREWLSERLERDVIDQFKAPLKEGVAALRDDSALESAVGGVVQGFVDQRVKARNAVATLELPGQAKAALENEALRGAVEPRLALVVGKAYPEIEGPLRTLAEPLDAARMQQSLGKIHDVVERAIQLSELQMDAGNRTDSYSAFWRMSLAPGGSEQARAIAENMRPGQDLNEFHAGVKHYRNDLALKVASEEGRAGQLGEAHYTPESFGRAAEYDTLLDSLAGVLESDMGAKPESLLAETRHGVSDAAVVTMRNLGLPMPAPLRLGEVQENVPLSDACRQAIEDSVESHKQAADAKPTQQGVFAPAIVDFNRATYIIDGQELPKDKQGVIDGFREFCKGPDGAMDDKMLQRVTAFANQGGNACAYENLFDSLRRPHIAVMDQNPFQTNAEISYEVSRDPSSKDVLLRLAYLTRPDHLAVSDDAGEFQALAIDGGKSWVRVDMDMRFDAQTCEPKIDNIHMGYAMHEAGGDGV